MAELRKSLAYWINIIVSVMNANAVTVENNTETDLTKFIAEITSMNVPTLGSDIPKPDSDDILKYNAGLNNDDLYLNGTQLINKYNFPVETHRVHTSDGYILTLFRIPCGGPPVFLFHGIILSSDDYIIAGPESAIGYSLAKEGYDVWLGNARGNKYSREHETLSPDKDPKFWDFSYHEIGIIDLPTMIDYVLNTTKRSKLLYVGHSQGIATFLVMCSERPEYNEKIKVVVALSPAVFISHMTSPVFRALALFDDEEYFLTQTIGYPNEILPSNAFTRTVTATLCGTEGLAAIICSNIVFLIIGFDYAQLNITNLPNIYQHAPAGSSVKQFIHFFQGVNSGKFRKFDYGETKNIQIYGSKSPPSYRLNKIKVPIAMFYSDNDWLVSAIDAHILRRKLPNVKEFYKVPFAKFNHLDYLWGKDIKTLVYNKISRIFRQYSSIKAKTNSICPKRNT